MYRITRAIEGRSGGGSIGGFLSVILFILLIATAIIVAGCEFESTTDQLYGPAGPSSGNSGNTTGQDTAGNGNGNSNGNGTDTTGNGGGDTTQGSQVAIDLKPVTATIFAGETTLLSATVTGTANTAVTWVIVSGPGTIADNGLFTAPSTVTNSPEITTIRVVSNADPSVSATAIIIIKAPTTGGGSGTGGETAGAGEVCFERDILPIFQSNCAKSGCHDVQSRRHGYAFVDYNGIMAGIRPNRPDNSEIYEKITEDRSDKVMPPPPNSRLSSAQISLIRKWINEGARNTICPPTSGCDTTTVTYSATIRPILDKYCIGCHSGATPPKGINLTNYDHVRTVANDGRFVGVTSRLPGYTPMPYGGSKLPDCELQQIKAWVNRGAKQD